MCSKVGCTVIIILFNLITISECTENMAIVKIKKQLENYQMLGELRDFCMTSKDCRTNAYVCAKQLCECAEGYKHDEKNKTCIGGVGAKCQYDSHCIDNAFCKHQLLCMCKEEYSIVSDDNWSCLGDWESRASINCKVVSILQYFLLILILKM